MMRLRNVLPVLLGALLFVGACRDDLITSAEKRALRTADAISLIADAEPARWTVSSTGVPMLDLGVVGFLVDINDDGVAVGANSSQAFARAPMRVRAIEGALAEDLGFFDASPENQRYGYAWAINNRGDIVGESSGSAFALSSGDSTLAIVGDLQGNPAFFPRNTQALDVGERGTVALYGNDALIGRVGSPQGQELLLPAGASFCHSRAVEDSAEPALVLGLCSGGALALWRLVGESDVSAQLFERRFWPNRIGWFAGLRWGVGRMIGGQSDRRATLLDLTDASPDGFDIDLGVLPGGSVSEAWSMSNGHVAGFGNTADGFREAIYWRLSGWDAGNRNPADLVIEQQSLGWLPGHVESAAAGVNAHGVVVGFSQAATGEQRAVAWFPSQTSVPNTPPDISITAPADGSDVVAGSAVTFTANASDAEDGALSGTAVQWASSLDGALGSGLSLTLSTLTVGSHEITATATDSEGASSAATIALTVSEPPPAWSILEELLELQRRVRAMAADGRLDRGEWTPLDVQLSTAIRHARADRYAPIRAVVGGLIRRVEQMAERGRMSAADAELLLPGLKRVHDAVTEVP